MTDIAVIVLVVRLVEILVGVEAFVPLTNIEYICSVLRLHPFFIAETCEKILRSAVGDSLFLKSCVSDVKIFVRLAERILFQRSVLPKSIRLISGRFSSTSSGWTSKLNIRMTRSASCPHYPERATTDNPSYPYQRRMRRCFPSEYGNPSRILRP